jgi:hypothetical protein
VKAITCVIGLASSLVVASPSFASMICNDRSTVDANYMVHLSEARDSASVLQVTIAGVQTVQTLACERLESDPLKTLPGQALLRCRDRESFDHGFVLVVHSPTCDGVVTAKLEQINIAGSKDLGELICREWPVY